jgi:Flp pilus assembly pilin Flp
MLRWAIRNFIRFDELRRGQTMTEYVIVLVTIAVAAVVAYQTFGTTISSDVTSVASDI